MQTSSSSSVSATPPISSASDIQGSSFFHKNSFRKINDNSFRSNVSDISGGSSTRDTSSGSGMPSAQNTPRSSNIPGMPSLPSMPSSTKTSKKKPNLSLSIKNIILGFCMMILVLVFVYAGFKYFGEVWSVPTDIRVTNIASRSATITWITEVPTKGVVIYAESDDFLPGMLAKVGKEVALDDRDVSEAVLEATGSLVDSSTGKVSLNEDIVAYVESERYYTHHVTVKDLDPEKTYYFRVGNGVRFTSSEDALADDEFTAGEKFSFSTFGETDTLLVPNPSYGSVIADGTGVTDGILYMVVDYDSGQELSSPLSTTLNDEGNWYVDLSNARTLDGELVDGLNETEDFETVYVNAGPLGQSGDIANRMDNDAPMPTIEVSVGEGTDVQSDGAEESKTPFVSYVRAGECVCDCNGAAGSYLNNYCGTTGNVFQQTIDGKCWDVVEHCNAVAEKGGETCSANHTYTVKRAQVSDSPCEGGGSTSTGEVTPPPSEPVPSNSDQSFLGDKCHSQAGVEGKCRWVPSGCTGGHFVNGQCPGSENVKCCIPEAKNDEDYESLGQCSQPNAPDWCFLGDACGKNGECQDNAYGKTDCTIRGRAGRYRSNLCGGGIEVRCCEPTNQEGSLGVNDPTDQSTDGQKSIAACGALCSDPDGCRCVNEITVVCDELEKSVANGEHCPEYINRQSESEETVQEETKKCCCTYEDNLRRTVDISSVENCSDFNGTLSQSRTGIRITECTDGSCPNNMPIDVPAQSCYYVGVMGCENSDVYCSTVTFGQEKECNGRIYECGKDSFGNCSWIGKERGERSCSCRKVSENLFEIVKTTADSCEEFERSTHEYTDCQELLKASRGDNGSHILSVGAPVHAKDVTYIISDNYVFSPETDGVYSITFPNGTSAEEVVMFEDKTYQFFIDDDNSGVKDEGEEYIDLEGLSIEITVDESLVPFTLNLSHGFNYISFNFLPGKSDSCELIKELNGGSEEREVTMLARFESGAFNVTSYRADAGRQVSGDCFPVVPGRGYIVRSYVYKDVPLGGFALSEPAQVGFDSPGWHLIGVNGAAESFTALSLIDSMSEVETVTVDNVTTWNYDSSRYEGLQKENNEVYGFDFPIEDKLAYFVRVSEGSGIWKPE